MQDAPPASSGSAVRGRAAARRSRRCHGRCSTGRRATCRGRCASPICSELPARRIVAAPGLRIALDAGAAGAGDGERTLGRPCRELRRRASRASSAAPATGRTSASGSARRSPRRSRSSSHKPVFVVVVPARVDPVVEHLLGSGRPATSATPAGLVKSRCAPSPSQNRDFSGAGRPRSGDEAALAPRPRA